MHHAHHTRPHNDARQNGVRSTAKAGHSPDLGPVLFTTVFVVLAALALLVSSASARAQGLFSPVVYVNDEAITNYDVNQKIQFLNFIGATGDANRETAIEHLIADRLQLQEVQRLGGRLTPDQMDTALNEFAARAEITGAEMLDRAEREGVDRDTVINFIRSGALWRELIRARYGETLRITDAQVEQAISVEGVQPVTEVLMSEIFLPADPQFAEVVQRIIPQIRAIRSVQEFSNAARQVSASPSGPSGGRINRWVNIAALPPELGARFETAGVGTVVGPIETPGAYAFFQLRGRRNSRDVPPEAVELDYRRVGLPGGMSDSNRSRVAQLRANMDGCVDFNAMVLRAFPELPATAPTSITRALPEVPAATRNELERLNPGEISANMVESGELVVLMLCARRVGGEGAPTPDMVRNGLINRALEGQAALYLQRLRSDADIRYPD